MMVALLAGCGAADTAETEHAPLPPMEQPGHAPAPKTAPAADRDCPLALPDAKMVSEVTADGVALVFTTTGAGDAAELRARVHQMAERHNEAQVPAEDIAAKSQSQGDGMASGDGAHGMDMHGAAREVPSRAVVEDISGGARIVFTPSDAAKVGLLREQIRVHGKEMASTNCSNAPARKAAPLPSGGERMPPLEPTPTPGPGEPMPPDRPKTPDQPVTPPAAPPPPNGQPFGR